MFSSLLFQNKRQQALFELNELLAFYESLAGEYKKNWNYYKIKKFIQTHDGIDKKNKKLQLMLIETLELPDQYDIKINNIKELSLYLK